MRYRSNLLSEKVTIAPSGSYAGCASGEESWGSEDAGKIGILIFCAGYAALIAAGYNEETSVLGCGTDFDKANDIIEFWQLESLDEWKKRAVEHMSKPENINAVKWLSDKLVIHVTIGGDHIMALMSIADDDEATEATWLQYIANFPVHLGYANDDA